MSSGSESAKLTFEVNNIPKIITDLLPENFVSIVEQVQHAIQNVIVISGVRGLILGIGLGTILLSIRILLGMERPYNK